MGTSDGRKFLDSFFKMNTATWLSLVLAVVTLATPAQPSEPRVVCYYTNWSVYRPGTARFNPQNINPYLCTHLVYAFGGFTKDNTFKPFDKYQDIEKGGYAKFTGLKTYNKKLKTLLAIGGWNEGSSRFSPMVASRDRRKEFVRNAIKFLRQNHFDGLDLDWEYPAFRDGGKPKDREHYAKLVRELREEFEREAEKTGKTRLLLTMAVPAGIEYIQKGFDVKTLNQYLDWMNLLTYDYHSAFEPAVNHHAPLYPLEEPNEYSVDNELNIDYTIKFYLESGADRDKLVLGIPTYGRSYTLFNTDAVEIGSPADGPGEQGDATREKGYLAYYEICEALKPKTTENKKRSTSDEDSDEDSEEEEEDLPWTVMHPNPSAMGPVAYKGNQWVGYDDLDIVRKKAEYVAENGLGGIMFWSIDNDDFRGNCHGKPYPLIEAAKEAYIVKLGSTDNAIAEKPRTTTARSSSRRRNHRTTTTTAKPSTAAKTNKRKSGSLVSSTTPKWNIITPEPPTTPDPGSDFKCTDEGFFPHPRDCKKYFWCLDSGPSNLGIVAHQFTCPSGLFFNKAADSCDFSRNVLCKISASTTKAPTTTKPVTTTTSSTTRRPVKLSTKSSALFRTTSTTPEPEEEEYEDEALDDVADIEAEDPKVIKELIDLIKKVGGVEQLEKQLHLSESSSSDGALTTTPSPFNKKLYQKVLERTRAKNKFGSNGLLQGSSQNSRRGPQNAGLEATADKDKLPRKDRPQYTTIQRSRSSTSSPDSTDDQDSDEDIQVVPQIQRARAVETEHKVATTTKPLQYVNIRRARPTSDTADDTASRNALFERPESIVTVSEVNSLDISSARRENMPEYVTIRRQRPTTEEATTEQYENTEADIENQDTALEREISSPSSQTKYTSIVRTRATTQAPEEISSPEPTTVLAVQISSLLNSPSEETETTIAEATEADATTTSTTTTSTTTTTPAPAPPSAPPRRTVLRRRGTTTTTTSTAAPSSTQTASKRPFLRRTKSTGPPDTAETDTIDTTTNKYTRRGVSKFKTRKETPQKEIGKDAGIENRRRPYLSGGATRSERPTRNFVRRRIGGANATSPTPTSTAASTAAPPPSSRRPFRVASRRRPGISSTSTTSTTEPPTTPEPTTPPQISEESLQDIGDIDAIEDPLLQERAAPKPPKIQRRPLLLKDEDQNPSATNDDERKRVNKNLSSEEEKKRQSKKYSSSFKQNQLDEVLRQKAKSEEQLDVTTEGKTTTIDDFSAETALAIAAHQLLAAPVPIIPNYDEEYTKPTKKSIPKTTQEYRFTSPDYTEDYTDSKTYSEDYSSTPIYKTTVAQEYPTSTGEYSLSPAVYDTPRTSTTTFVAPKSSAYPSSAFTGRVSRPSGFSTASVLNSLGLSQNLVPSTVSSFSSTSAGPTRGIEVSSSSEYSLPSRGSEFSTSPTRNSEFTTSRVSDYTGSTRGSQFSTGPTRSSFSLIKDFSSPIDNIFPRGRSTYPGLDPSTVSPGLDHSRTTGRYLGSREKLIPIPVEDYSLSPEGYTGLSQEPSYFTREYLLESPVTKVYDDEYQYLSPVTTPQTTTRKLPKKTVYRKISTTLRPSVPSATTPKPRRVPERKPFEKVAKPEPKRTYRPIENYDYYDDSQEKMVHKYEEGTKVVLHGKGTIECLDIGNFPHPSSCKKFISCARLENGSLLGWEYVCPKGLSFDPVGGICNWSAGLGCDEKDN